MVALITPSMGSFDSGGEAFRAVAIMSLRCARILAGVWPPPAPPLFDWPAGASNAATVAKKFADLPYPASDVRLMPWRKVFVGEEPPA